MKRKDAANRFEGLTKQAERGNMAFFTVENLTAGYGGKLVLEEVSFSLDSGCVLGILGANGSGKTTLLKTLCNLLPHKGSCILEETLLEKLTPGQMARLCGYIPQRSGISLDISALDVVLMGFNPHLKLLERPTPAMRAQAAHALTLAGLAGKEASNYQTLSEGQKQLCILARTLCTGSRLLFLDEPESALDFRFRYRLFTLLQDWLNETETPRAAVISLHDPFLALNYCHRLLLLSEGRILGSLCPKTDSPDRMEALLTRIYGEISLVSCTDRSGRKRLVMLKEEP